MMNLWSFMYDFKNALLILTRCAGYGDWCRQWAWSSKNSTVGGIFFTSKGMISQPCLPFWCFNIPNTKLFPKCHSGCSIWQRSKLGTHRCCCWLCRNIFWPNQAPSIARGYSAHGWWGTTIIWQVTLRFSLCQAHFPFQRVIFSSLWRRSILNLVVWLAGSRFRGAASDYLKKAGEIHGTVVINVSVGKFLNQVEHYASRIFNCNHNHN